MEISFPCVYICTHNGSTPVPVQTTMKNSFAKSRGMETICTYLVRYRKQLVALNWRSRGIQEGRRDSDHQYILRMPYSPGLNDTQWVGDTITVMQEGHPDESCIILAKEKRIWNWDKPIGSRLEPDAKYSSQWFLLWAEYKAQSLPKR